MLAAGNPKLCALCPQRINYAQILLVVLLLARLFLSTRQLVYLALTVVFAVVLVDDSMEIHEEGGKYFVKALHLKPLWGMRAVDFGEVITWAIVAAIVMPLVLAGLRFSKRTHVVNGLALMLPFLALVFFALFVDQVYHVLRNAFFGADILLGMLEDGGEMVAITTECALAAALVRAGPTFCDESL